MEPEKKETLVCVRKLVFHYKAHVTVYMFIFIFPAFYRKTMKDHIASPSLWEHLLLHHLAVRLVRPSNSPRQAFGIG